MADFDEARRGRIIKHMNNEHRSSLTAYLRHYAKVPENIAAESPELVDVTPAHMLIRTADKQEHIVAFDPPLASVNDIRPRVVEMDGIARAGLGENRGIIKRYELPTGISAVVFGLVGFYFGCYASLPWILPGTAVWDALAYFPGGPHTFRWLVKTIFWPVVAIHTTEAILFDRMRMARYGVPRFSGLWFKWMLNVLIEGKPTFDRVEAMAQKELKSH